MFNVSPASIYIIYNSYNTFMENLSANESDDEDKSEAGGSITTSGKELFGTFLNGKIIIDRIMNLL